MCETGTLTALCFWLQAAKIIAAKQAIRKDFVFIGLSI